MLTPQIETRKTYLGYLWGLLTQGMSGNKIQSYLQEKFGHAYNRQVLQGDIRKVQQQIAKRAAVAGTEGGRFVAPENYTMQGGKQRKPYRYGVERQVFVQRYDPFTGLPSTPAPVLEFWGTNVVSLHPLKKETVIRVADENYKKWLSERKGPSLQWQVESMDPEIVVATLREERFRPRT